MAKQTILLIEDDPNIRDVISLALDFEGYEVIEAINGLEGWKHLEEGLEPNLIILDLMMPVMNGWEFLDKVKMQPKYNLYPIVVASAYSDKTVRFKNSPFLEKPIDLSTLIQTVKKYIKE